jgi:hypothetical protein
MKIKYYISIPLIAFQILRGGNVTAQTTVQVVTKTIEKTFAAGKDISLNLDAERAKKDLNALKYISEMMGKTLYLRNYIAIEKGEAKPQSELKARYTLTIPTHMSLSVKNTFGKLTIEGIESKVSIFTEFCKTQLTDIQGIIAINSRFGDISGVDIAGNISIESNRSDMQLYLKSGACAIVAQYGTLKIEADKTVTQVNIKADRSEVHFWQPPATAILYDLESNYGKVLLPSTLSKANFSEKNTTKEKTNFRYFAPDALSKQISLSVFIQTTFNNINIETKP